MSVARTALLTLSVLGLASCGGLGKGGGLFRTVTERELPFKTKITNGDDRRDFVIVASKAAEADVDDVRESVRHKATRYCIYNIGSSQIDWDMDPATEDWAYTRDGENLGFSGRCIGK